MSRRPRILTPSIRPFGPTQDRRWISRKPREPGIRVCFYGRGEIDSAPSSCCGLREKTPLNFLQRVVDK